MKKILALVLALSLLLCTVPASAVMLLQNPFSFDVTLFRTYFETFYAASVQGKTVTWTEGNGTLTATGDSMMDVVLHLDSAGKVTHMTCNFSGGTSEMSYTAGTNLGVSSSLMAMSALMAETNDANALQTAAANIEAEYNVVFDCMLNADNYTMDQLTKGVSSEGTLMGYPAQLSYSVDMTDASTPLYSLQFTLAPMGTTF